MNGLAIILIVIMTSWNVIKLLSAVNCVVFRLWTDRDFPGEIWMDGKRI